MYRVYWRYGNDCVTDQPFPDLGSEYLKSATVLLACEFLTATFHEVQSHRRDEASDSDSARTRI